MKTTLTKFAAAASLAIAAVSTSFAQTNLGADCGCPPVGSRSTVSLSTLAVTGGGATDGDLIATTTRLTCDKIWLLDNKIYVPAGKTLIIDPGTLVKGVPTGNPLAANAILVQKDGKMFANGDVTCPVVFTAQADPMDGTYGIANRGQWGGIVVLGKGRTNLVTTNTFGTGTGANGVGFIEGFTAADARNLYGMPVGTEVNDDNSGIFKYMSIRHAGATVGANNELNGLTLGGVGSGTTVDHIEVISNDDDGVEMFGGSVNVKYVATLFGGDDNLDYDLGWNGKAQFVFALKTDATTTPGGDGGIEADGDDNKLNPSFYSHPFIYNATFIGNGSNVTPPAGGTGPYGIAAKEKTEGEIYNSIFANFRSGFNMVKALGTRTGGIEAYQNWNSGLLKVNCNTFIGNTAALTVDGSAANVLPADDAKFLADGNVIATTIPGFDFLYTMNTSTNVVTDKYNATPTPALATTCTPPTDGFYSPANYRGAFESGKSSWLSDWSYASVLGITNGLVPCPTDINGDGITSNLDFLQLLSKFNQSCN
jgi:hypothetical protein